MRKTNKSNKEYLLVILISVILSTLCSFLLLKLTIFVQKALFNSSGCIMLITSCGFWLALLLLIPWFVFFLIFIDKISIIFKIKEMNMDSPRKHSKPLKKYLVICVCLYLISIFNYCKITKDGVYIRDITTIFTNTFYKWSRVSKLKIESYRNSGRGGGSINLRFVVCIKNRNINLMNSGLYDKNYLNKLRTVFLIVKENNLTIEREISEIDKNNLKRLLYIENQ